MFGRVLVLAATLLAAPAAFGHTYPSLPPSFHATTIHSPEGAEIFVRSGGSGPVVVLLHGYAENSDSWAPLAADLMKDHTVVVPDLRGIGRSSKPETGYDKKTEAKDIRAVVTGLGYDRTFVVAHDIGNMVAYAYAAMYPDKVERLVVMDAPIPGIDPWNEILLNPGVWHFNFHGPDAERLVAGRERIYFDRIWNDFTADPHQPDEDTRNFFAATYAQPGGMRAGFAQFTAFSQPGAYYGNRETKYGINYGGGLKVKVKEPWGFRLDVRQYNMGKPFKLPNGGGRLLMWEFSGGLSFLL